MEFPYHGAAALDEGDQGEHSMSDQPDPAEEVPFPNFGERRRRATWTGGATAAAQQSVPVGERDPSVHVADSAESGRDTEGSDLQASRLRRAENRQQVNFTMSPSDTSQGEDPWMQPQNDPWRSTQRYSTMVAENWSSDSNVVQDDYGWQWENWSSQSWSDGRSDNGWSDRSWHNSHHSDYQNSNWDVMSQRSNRSFHSGWGDTESSPHSDAYRYYGYGGQGGDDGRAGVDHSRQGHRWEDQPGDDQTVRQVPATRRWYNWENWDDHQDGLQVSSQDGSSRTNEMELQSPASPQALTSADQQNKPLGQVPSGNPSIAGNSHGNVAQTTGKLSSSYPPIFYARPGESWEEYWRSVSFWIASESRALPAEMRGPRLMQQLRERAAKIVQHLSVDEVSGSDGIEVIKKTIESSPIIKILDQKKVDRRRQKFLRLQRLPQESFESFLNRAEIYRRENQSSPE